MSTRSAVVDVVVAQAGRASDFAVSLMAMFPPRPVDQYGIIPLANVQESQRVMHAHALRVCSLRPGSYSWRCYVRGSRIDRGAAGSPSPLHSGKEAAPPITVPASFRSLHARAAGCVSVPLAHCCFRYPSRCLSGLRRLEADFAQSVRGSEAHHYVWKRKLGWRRVTSSDEAAALATAAAVHCNESYGSMSCSAVSLWLGTKEVPLLQCCTATKRALAITWATEEPFFHVSQLLRPPNGVWGTRNYFADTGLPIPLPKSAPRLRDDDTPVEEDVVQSLDELNELLQRRQQLHTGCWFKEDVLQKLSLVPRTDAFITIEVTHRFVCVPLLPSSAPLLSRQPSSWIDPHTVDAFLLAYPLPASCEGGGVFVFTDALQTWQSFPFSAVTINFGLQPPTLEGSKLFIEIVAADRCGLRSLTDTSSCKQPIWVDRVAEPRTQCDVHGVDTSPPDASAIDVPAPNDESVHTVKYTPIDALGDEAPPSANWGCARKNRSHRPVHDAANPLPRSVFDDLLQSSRLSSQQENEARTPSSTQGCLLLCEDIGGVALVSARERLRVLNAADVELSPA